MGVVKMWFGHVQAFKSYFLKIPKQVTMISFKDQSFLPHLIMIAIVASTLTTFSIHSIASFLYNYYGGAIDAIFMEPRLWIPMNHNL